MSALLKRRAVLLVASAVAAIVSAKTTGVHHFGFFDGP
jgi:hypothetical protein